MKQLFALDFFISDRVPTINHDRKFHLPVYLWQIGPVEKITKRFKEQKNQ